MTYTTTDTLYIYLGTVLNILIKIKKLSEFS